MPPDRFDDLRREWIARHASVFPIQKRRAEVLNRRIRPATTNTLVRGPALLAPITG